MAEESAKGYIYLVVNSSMWWFEDNGIPNKRGVGTAHPYSKVGETGNLASRLSQYNQPNTGMPCVYRYEFAMKVNDSRAAESKAKYLLKERNCRQEAPGLGVEWYFATAEQVRAVFESIQAEFDGEFVDPPPPRTFKSQEDVRKIVKDKQITTSDAYREVKDELYLPDSPWKETTAYKYLNPDAVNMDISVFVAALKTRGIQKATQYEQANLTGFPTLQNIADGYFEGFKSLTEIVDRYMPLRSRR